MKWPTAQKQIDTMETAKEPVRNQPERADAVDISCIQASAIFIIGFESLLSLFSSCRLYLRDHGLLHCGRLLVTSDKLPDELFRKVLKVV